MLKRNEWTRGRIALREWLPVIVLMCLSLIHISEPTRH